jgi:hypothetical protein
MAGRVMTVTFHRRGRVCSWTALRPPRTVVPGSAMAIGADIPHDLSTFVIEAALGIDHGFWGCVADGATFRSLGRRRTPQGRAVITSRRAELDAAEVVVNGAYGAWRAGHPTEAAEALDEMLVRWRALSDGDDLVVEWPLATPRRR